MLVFCCVFFVVIVVVCFWWGLFVFSTYSSLVCFRADFTVDVNQPGTIDFRGSVCTGDPALFRILGHHAVTTS